MGARLKGAGTDERAYSGVALGFNPARAALKGGATIYVPL